MKQIKFVDHMELVKKQKPDYEKASAYVEAFDQAFWEQTLRQFLGKGAEAMIAVTTIQAENWVIHIKPVS